MTQNHKCGTNLLLGLLFLVQIVVFMVCKVIQLRVSSTSFSTMIVCRLRPQREAPRAQKTPTAHRKQLEKRRLSFGKKRGRKHFERAEDLLVWPAVCSRWWPELQPSVFGWSRRGWLLSSGIYDGHSCYTLHRKHSSTAVYHVIRTWSLRAQFCIYNVTDCTSIYFLT